MSKEEISNEKMREALEKIILKAKDMHSFFQAWASAGKYAEDIISIAQSAIDEDEPRVCPFCGKKPLVHSDGNMYEVRCENDDCKVAPSSYRYSSRGDAVDAWNERG